MNNHHEKILKILEDSGSRGMNSFYWRTSFIQLPVRIMELKKIGYSITTRKNKDKSVDYILLGKSQTSQVTTHPYTEPNHPTDDDLVRVEKLVGGVMRVFWEPKESFKQEAFI